MGIVNCRSCGADGLRIILDLGSQPIANALLLEEELGRPDARYPRRTHLRQLVRVLAASRRSQHSSVCSRPPALVEAALREPRCILLASFRKCH